MVSFATIGCRSALLVSSVACQPRPAGSRGKLAVLAATAVGIGVAAARGLGAVRKKARRLRARARAVPGVASRASGVVPRSLERGAVAREREPDWTPRASLNPVA